MRRNKKRIAGVDAINKIIRSREDSPIHSVAQSRRWPPAPVDVHHQRAVRQHVQVVVAARGPSKNMPDPQVFVANGLQHNGALAPPATLLVHALVLDRALRPPPVTAVQTADAARQAALRVSPHDVLEVLHGGGAQIEGLVLLQDKLNQAGHCFVSGSLAELGVVIRAVRRRPVGQHTQRGHQLLQRMCLELPGRVGSLTPPGLVLQVFIDAHKQRSWHAEPSLEVGLVVGRRATIHAEVLPPNGVHRLLELSRLVASLTRVRSGEWTPCTPSQLTPAAPCVHGNQSLAKKEGDGNVLVIISRVPVERCLSGVHRALLGRACLCQTISTKP